MATKPKKGDAAKLQIYADAEHIDDFTVFFKRLGMNQREAGSRLFAWFNRQSPLIRREILQPMPEEVAPDIARIILERMAEQDRLRQPQTQTDTISDDVISKSLPEYQPQRLTVRGPDSPTE